LKNDVPRFCVAKEQHNDQPPTLINTFLVDREKNEPETSTQLTGVGCYTSLCAWHQSLLQGAGDICS